MSRLGIWAAGGIGSAISYAFDWYTTGQLAVALVSSAIVLLMHRFGGKA